jgi:tetratricopeptide (TPR) repeat protein
MKIYAKTPTRSSARKNIAVAALLAAVIYFVAPTPGCGPFLPDAIFTYAVHPDFPLVKFARGDLGILQPSYARSYLVIAYRYLAGVPFSAKEQQAALAVWKARLASDWYAGQPSEQSKTKPQLWLELRQTVPGMATSEMNANDPPEIRMAGQPYQWYYSCLSDAFVTASSTLRERIAKFGASSTEVKAWLSAQDQVFANCTDDLRNSGVVVPVAAKPDENPLIRSDRAYQNAAAYFYAEDFPKAEALFAEIAADKSSPWAETARLLVARSYIREATLDAEEGSSRFRYAPMAKAEAHLKSILADKGLADLHPAARRLLGFVEFRVHPRERLLELATNLSRKDGSGNFEQDLIDYTLLLDRWANLANDSAADGRSKPSATGVQESLEKLRAESDVTDWVLTMQSPGEDAANHAIERWQQLHSISWLVATLATISPQHPQAAAIAAAAANTSPDSAAFPTITFHRTRIFMNSGKQDAAREELDRVLAADRENFPPSSLNLIMAERFRLARNFDEFLKYAPREAAGIVTFNYDSLPDDLSDSAFSMNAAEYKPATQVPLFDADSVRLINRQLPLAMLQEAANSSALPEDLRAQVAQVAWVRAVLLEDDAAAKSLAPVVAKLTPALQSEIEKISAENTPESRHFAAVLTIFRNPGLRPNATAGILRREALGKIDQYRDNWWCSAVEPWDRQNQGGGSGWAPALSAPLQSVYSGDNSQLLSFLTIAEEKSAAENWERIVAAGAAPDYLTQSVLAWAKSHPDDERVPEALHFTVRPTRFGCTTPSTGKLSRQAFELLHSKYPKSPWAAKTKYWYAD